MFSNSSKRDFVSYNLNTHIFEINFEEDDLDYLKDLCMSTVTFAVGSGLLKIRSLKSIVSKLIKLYSIKIELIIFFLNIVLASFFFYEKVIYKHLNITIDLSVFISKKFSNIKDVIKYLLKSKIIIKINGKDYTIRVPVTMAYTIQIESHIINALSYISNSFSYFKHKPLKCEYIETNTETSENL